MAIISLRVTDKEKKELEEASKVYGGLSNMIRTLVFEKLYDEYDIRIAEDFLKNEKKIRTRDISELADEVGIDYESLQD